MTEPDFSDSLPTVRLQTEAVQPNPPAYDAAQLGYPSAIQMPHGYGYPMAPMMPPPGYPMPPGYALPPGYAMQPGLMYPQGYPALPPGYVMVPQAYPGYPQAESAVPVATPVLEAVPVSLDRPRIDDVPAPWPTTDQAVPFVPIEPDLERRHLPSSGLPIVPRVTSTNLPDSNSFVRKWRNIGGGSLTLSLLIHAGVLAVGGLIVFSTAMQEKAVDFMPGGGTQQGAAATAALSHQIQQKKRSILKKSMPKQRLVSSSLNAAITLPDTPPDLIDLPDVSNSLGRGMKLGSGGFGSAGAGGGFNASMGLGGAKGFVGMTLFGKLGGEGMPGVFYDMKQTPERVPTALAELAGEKEFAGVINTAAARKFSGKGLDQFFHSTQKMSFNYLLIPYMSANEGPKAFKVENEVQPRAWMVHYSTDMKPPAAGDYRFVGLFDDALIVYVNGRPVLDGSWYSIVEYGEKRRDEDIRQNFGGPVVPGTGGRQCYAGKWVKMEGTTRIDIVVGERPGGRVGGLLLVQARKGKYAERPDRTPILPVFSTTPVASEDLERLRKYSASGFEVAEETPVFGLTKDVFATP